MPITQARMIDVIDGAEVILDVHKAIRNVMVNVDDITSRANSIAEHTPDPLARDMVQELLAMINVVNDLMIHANGLYVDAAPVIMAEAIHFRRVKRSNEKAAYYQRHKRMLLKLGQSQPYTTASQPARASTLPRAQAATVPPLAVPAATLSPTMHLTMAERQQRREASGIADDEVYYRPGYDPSRIAPEGDETPLAVLAQAPATLAAAGVSGKPPPAADHGQASGHYSSDVASTSVPDNATLYAPAKTSEEDIL